MTLLIAETEIDQLFTFESAVSIAEEVFRMAGEGMVVNPARVRMPFDKGFLQYGPAALLAKRVVGYKIWSNFGYQLEGTQRKVWNYLFNMDSQELIAIIQAYTIGKYRTSAVSAVAAKYLSPPDASRVGLYGSGRYAEGQLEAVTKVRPVKSVRVYSRTPEKREAFCRKMSQRLGIEVLPASAPEEAARDAEIIVTMTDSEHPVLFGDWLPKSCLVIAAGANHWFEREVDGGVISRAQLVVVDEMEQAKAESGDILWAVGHGLISWAKVRELGNIISGETRIPEFGTGITLFESHGIAAQDVAFSLAAHEQAKVRGIGREVQL